MLLVAMVVRVMAGNMSISETRHVVAQRVNFSRKNAGNGPCGEGSEKGGAGTKTLDSPTAAEQADPTDYTYLRHLDHNPLSRLQRELISAKRQIYIWSFRSDTRCVPCVGMYPTVI